ncbi:uncharacterized protein CC84DRAFT_841092 [Paraphaeosphaeria sporulosa]|uniref:WSC domain-containing protein n=1 Tax=Paraphaeosphaeria sporulosa TaxID=1460663 RepID=A0A177C8M4_9PLEO|nr:uncharacterized protein CC84DRAFT_841092 [Paraphaeosphaeria sporulosa]OAG03481.1 hypothetical protein CC84DRAFT_841092 [Paraphaeosphaeria sporulosa]
MPSATSVIGEILNHMSPTTVKVETATKTIAAMAPEAPAASMHASVATDFSASFTGDVTANYEEAGWANITILDDAGFWYNQGCFVSESSNKSAMGDILHVSSKLVRWSDKMDVRLCRQHCAYYAPDEGHEYFGIANGQECYCGNFISNHARRVDQSNCHLWCPPREDRGDDKFLCGGKGSMIVYGRRKWNMALQTSEDSEPGYRPPRPHIQSSPARRNEWRDHVGLSHLLYWMSPGSIIAFFIQWWWSCGHPFCWVWSASLKGFLGSWVIAGIIGMLSMVFYWGCVSATRPPDLILQRAAFAERAHRIGAPIPGPDFIH